MSSDSRTPHDIWQTAVGELQLQLPREAFDTWLRGARLVAHEDGTYIIGVANIYAREWLEHRLKKVIVRTLSQIAGRSVELRVVVWTGEQEKADLREAGPLMAELSPAEPEEVTFEAASAGHTGLNQRLILEDYVVGESNKLAHAAAMAVLDTPGTHFNPLMLHATVGLGKTHLLHAMGNAATTDGMTVLFVTGERFTNELVAAIKAKRTPEFRDKYRGVDLLLVDDIEFIAGKDATQEEFYHTFNALVEQGAQVVLAGGLPPGEIRKLDERLQSRFVGGLVVEITPPDYDTRLEILSIKVRQRGFEGRISPEVLEVIAEESVGSIRELEGALNRLVASALINQEAPNLRVAETAINHTRATQASISFEDVLFAVAGYYGLDPDELTGRARSRDVSGPRQVAMYLAYKHTNTSLQQIGEALGGRNHSTVLYSCERIDDLMKTDSQARRDVQQIMQVLKHGVEQ
jgi:chromosomal replication initiator protein